MGANMGPTSHPSDQSFIAYGFYPGTSRSIRTVERPGAVARRYEALKAPDRLTPAEDIIGLVISADEPVGVLNRRAGP
jgi:hypothetical protein